MIRLFCTEVVVKFKGGHRQAQAIRFSNGPTTAHKLVVTDDGVRLAVYFVGKTGDIVEMIGFPYHEVAEYHCREVNDRTPVSSTPAPTAGEPS